MKHYSMAAWTDFIRGLTNGSDRSEMTRHLNAPCPECGRLVALLGAVKESEAPVEVPDAMVARARAIFPKREAPRRESAVERLVASLLFDSFASAVPRGARSTASSVRRLSFGAGETNVELVVDAPKGGAVTLTGTCSATGREVHLYEKQRLLQTVNTSAFGEFHLQFEPHKGMRLVITNLPARGSVEVPLDFLLPLKQKKADLDPTRSTGSSEIL